MFHKKNKKIKVPVLQMDNGVIIYNNSFICTKNISLISILESRSNKLWILAVITGLLGIYLGAEVGIYLIISSVILFVLVMVYNVNRSHNLAISLNSGTTLYFSCKDREFLGKVAMKLLNSIKENNHSKCTISFSQCTIYDGVLNGALIK